MIFVDNNRLLRIGIIAMRVVLVVLAGSALTGATRSPLFINAYCDLHFNCVERSECIVIDYTDNTAGLFVVVGEGNERVRLTVDVSNPSMGDEHLRLSVANDQCAYSLDRGQTWHTFTTGQLFQETSFPAPHHGGETSTILVRVGGSLVVGNTQHRGDYEGPITLTVAYLDCPDGGGCTYSKGYWKNHHDWPLGYSPHAAWFNNPNICWLDVLWTQPRGSKDIQLAHQYIAAVLNVANGASANVQVDGSGMTIQDIIDEATVHFEGTSSIPKKTITKYKDYLDSYNNGFIGPGHCD